MHNRSGIVVDHRITRINEIGHALWGTFWQLPYFRITQSFGFARICICLELVRSKNYKWWFCMSKGRTRGILNSRLFTATSPALHNTIHMQWWMMSKIQFSVVQSRATLVIIFAYLPWGFVSTPSDLTHAFESGKTVKFWLLSLELQDLRF